MTVNRRELIAGQRGSGVALVAGGAVAQAAPDAPPRSTERLAARRFHLGHAAAIERDAAM